MSTPIEEKMDIVAFSLFPPQGPLGEEQKGVAACQEVVVLVVHLVLVLPCTSPDVEDSADVTAIEDGAGISAPFATVVLANCCCCDS